MTNALLPRLIEWVSASPRQKTLFLAFLAVQRNCLRIFAVKKCFYWHSWRFNFFSEFHPITHPAAFARRSVRIAQTNREENHERSHRGRIMLNAALVGVGHWGKRLAASIQGSESIRFVGAVSRNPARDEAFARETGIPLIAGLDAALADPAIDAVVLATPNSTHCEQVVQAAAAGKHVYVEKPITLTRGDAERAVEACRKAGVTLAVGFNRRFAPAPIDFVKRIRGGEIGEVMHLEGQHSGATGYQYQSIRGHWRATRHEAPGGGMTGRGVHTVDTMMQIAGTVTSVYAYSERRVLDAEIDDTTSMLLRFSSGVSGYHATVFATAEYCRVAVFGSKGWMEMTDDTHITVRSLKGQPERKSYPAPNKERGVLEGFAAAVAAGNPFMVPPEHVVNSVALLEAIVESAASGRPVSIP